MSVNLNHDRAWPNTLGRLLPANLLLFAIYAGAGLASLQFGSALHPQVSAIWIPSGVALAALLLFGYRLLPGIALGAFAVHFWASGSIMGALGIACGYAVASWASAALLQRVSDFQQQMSSLRDVSSLLLHGVLVLPLIASVAGTASLFAIGDTAGAAISDILLVWWMGDAMGVLVVTPLLLGLFELTRMRPSDLRKPEALVLLVLQTGIVLMIVTGQASLWLNADRPNYFLLPVALTLALRHRMLYSAAANAILVALAFWAFANALGQFSATGPYGGLLQLQLMLAVFTCVTLIVNAVSEERSRILSIARENLVRFQELTEVSADWYWEQDEKMRFTFVSGGVQARAHVDPNAHYGKTRWELHPQDKTDIDWEAHRRVLDAREPFDITYKRIFDDGTVGYLHVIGRPIFDKNKVFRGYRGIGQDVTAERLAEQTLRQSEGRFRALTDLLADWYWEQDENLRFTFVTGKHHDRAGFTKVNAIGKTRFELPNIFESEEARLQHQQDLDARRSFRDLVLKRVRADGETRWAAISGEPTYDENGRFTGYRGTGRDISAQKITEAAQRESESRFMDLTSLSSDWYWEQDAELRFSFLSAAVQDKTGVSADSRLGKLRWELPGLQFDEATLAEHKAQVYARKPFRDFVYKRLSADGREIWVSVTGKPIFDKDGVFTGYRGIGRDITQETIAERRLQRLRDYYALLSEANNAIIRASDSQHLFDAVCRVAVEQGHFQFAWIGALNAETRALRPVAVAGDHRDYPYRLKLSSDPNITGGLGSAGQVLRTGVPVVSNDSLEAPTSGPWLDLMRAAGFRAHATFPLRRAGQTVGTLHLYSAERDVFDPELIALLNRVALNLSFALDGFDRDAARNMAEQALRDSERRFRDIAEVAGEFVWENDTQGRFTYISPRVTEVLGYRVNELIGRSASEFMPPGESERVRDWFAEHMKPGGTFKDLEHQFVAKSGEILWLHISGVATWDSDGRRTGHRGTSRDITQIKRSEARISYLATRDPLTELPNRLLFNDRLEQGVISARRAGVSVGVLFIDLDRFKNINDSLGHHIGDLLLKEVAQRMSGCIRGGDTLARLGGDEFVIALEQLRRAEDATLIAAKIVQTLSRPIEVGGQTLSTSCSIGISIFPVDADDVSTLMRNADTAMYHAKEKGRNNFQFFSPDMNVRAVERHKLEVALRLALERDEFVLHYQPQVALASGKIVGAEALIRWQHPERGLIVPGGFIATAEETSLIEPIGRWVLMQACTQAKKWQETGSDPIRVAVNISARQLLDPREFLRYVQQVLDETGLDPRSLELEVTESLLLANVEDNIEVFRKLGKLGIHIAVDDFGTGYSSLAYLKQLPIDTLKVDRTFVRDIETDPEDAAIVTAIIAMAHSLKLRVTAEGVEDPGQLQALRALHCDQYQGYLLSKPLASDEFAKRFIRPKLRLAR